MSDLFVFRFDPATAVWSSIPITPATDMLVTLQEAVGGLITTLTRTRIEGCPLVIDCYCDDEALLKADPIIGWKCCSVPFVNALVLVGATADGEAVGLPISLLPSVEKLVARLTVADLRELLGDDE